MAPRPVNPFTTAKRVVIKIGSALLIDGERNEIRQTWLRTVLEDVVACRANGQQILIVSSGAIALGRRVLGLPQGPLRLEERQASAACGQVRLAHAYQEELARHSLGGAQVLLTPFDTEEWKSYLNVRATLRNLLGFNVIPVINENDTVTTPMRRFGDNDRLAARVAAMVEADCLVLLSDIDGLFTANPRIDPKATLVPEVFAMTPEIMAMAGESASVFSSGGMVTKLEAARIALKAGCTMAITRGDIPHPLAHLAQGKPCTWFLPSVSPVAARKIWIAGSLNPRGSLRIDAGAVQALDNGKSLLPVGVTSVVGEFSRGDAVRVVTAQGNEIARGLIAYGSDDAKRIVGRRSDEFESLLGYTGAEELIHRDDLALL